MTTTADSRLRLSERGFSESGPSGRASVRAAVDPGSDACLVTVLAPKARLDVALPANLAVAEVLPSLVKLCRLPGGGPGGPGTAPAGWTLSRLGEPALASGESLATHHIRDGDILVLRPAEATLPAARYDDTADAIAAVSSARPRWTLRHGRLAATAAGCGLLAVLTAALTRLPPTFATPGGAALTVAALVGAAALRRRSADLVARHLAGAAALAGAIAAGVSAAAGQPTPARCCIVGVMVALAAVAGFAAGRVGVTVFTAAATAGALTAVAGLLGAALSLLIPGSLVPGSLVPGSLVAVAALAVVVSIAVLPVVPRLAARFATLPGPIPPAGSGESGTAAASDPNSPELRRLADRALHLGDGMIAAAAALAAAGSVVLVWAGGSAETALASAAVVALLSRCRRAPRLSPLLTVLAPAGLATGAVLVRVASTGAAGAVAVIMASTLVTIAMIAGLARNSAPTTPALHRLADAVEALATAALLPLLLLVLDVYRAVRLG